MSLRDWFAGMALQGYTSDNNSVTAPDWETAKKTVCRCCYEYADAMISERDKIHA